MKQYNVTQDTQALNAFIKRYGEDKRNYFLATHHVEQLRSCQAWIIYDRMGNQWLQSYNTIVSVAWRVPEGYEVEHFGKWSVTTSRQQTWFARRF